MGDFFLSLSYPQLGWRSDFSFAVDTVEVPFVSFPSPISHSFFPEATPTVNVGVNPFRVFLILQLQTQISVKDTVFYSFV